MVFHSTPDEVSTLRDIFIDTLYGHLDALKDKRGIKVALCEILRLAYILLQRKCEEYPPQTIRSTKDLNRQITPETRRCRACDQYAYFLSDFEIAFCRDCWEERARWH